ncbi:MAG TPA: Rrf2 family transcriptional regulator [Patescibacteria group bacterium]|nr:Rrf2 family transcriptional regulator [Patescibacteria group bacterium]
MIRLSRREDYAVILVNALVEAYEKRLVPLSEIAKEFELSPLFLRNVAADLREAVVIKAVEGKNGGYSLTKNPDLLTMGDVLRPFSKDDVLTCCSKEGKADHHRICPQKDRCVAGNVWRKLNKELMDKVYALTLREFLRLN